MKPVVALGTVACLNMLAAAKVPDSPTRVALVIGNSTYSGIWPALNREPQRDAELMRDTLTQLGFQVVYRNDADLPQMKTALREFRDTLRKSPGALAVVYYAGHATQAFVSNAKGAVHIENFLVPARTDLDAEANVREKALAQDKIETVIRDSDAAAGVILLDASRDNALTHQQDGANVTLRGLAPHHAPGQVVVYATRPGRLAYRTSGDTPSLFTQALAAELSSPGTLSAALQRVQERVRQATQDRAHGSQLPAIRDRLDPLAQQLALVSPEGSEAVAASGAAAPAAPVKQPPKEPPVVRQREPAPVRAKAASGVNSGSVAGSGAGSAAASGAGVSPPAGLDAAIEGPAAESFRDCVMCPEMVRVRGGNFTMGSPEDEALRGSGEGPAHEVHIAYSLAVSKFPITRGQWRQYLTETGQKGSRNCYGFNNVSWKRAKTPEYGWDDPGYRQEDSHPAVCVSWTEAQAYTTWLSQKTAHHYRLLSESELEYIERASARSAYPWGATAEAQCQHANAADAVAKARFAAWNGSATCNDGFLFTSPVDHFPPSAFGLHDTAGNVRVWAQDCYHDNYRGAPADGSAWESGGDCSQRVIRGAAWDTLPEGLRSAARHADAIDSNTDNTGLRVARTDIPGGQTTDKVR